jgi:hypothetical protein
LRSNPGLTAPGFVLSGNTTKAAKVIIANEKAGGLRQFYFKNKIYNELVFKFNFKDSQDFSNFYNFLFAAPEPFFYVDASFYPLSHLFFYP